MKDNAQDMLAAQYAFSDSVVVKNRIFKSAMSEQLGDKNHNPTDKLVTLYRLWAAGDIGISVSGNIMIDRAALSGARDVVLDQHSDLDSFRRWTAAGSENNTHFWAQINHPGKQIISQLCAQPVAPSVVPLGNGLARHFNLPRALTDEEILALIDKFASCAARCKQVGFGGVQIHAAHGYLISQFLSPLHNIRTDRWGGSLQNRMRFLVATYESIRLAVGPDYPVAIKLNSADFQRGGFSEAESMQVAKMLDEMGIDQIEISGGTYENPVMMGNMKESTRARESYFLEYAKQIRTQVNTALVVTGGFRSATGMRACLQSGAADFVGVARALAIDPKFATQVLCDTQSGLTLPRDPQGEHMSIAWYESKIRGLTRQVGTVKVPKIRTQEGV
ncbi:NADH:flavin oxidoreductase/NADH oxidase family protein [Pseudoalteromonas sp. Of7M-16]|uniref:NADH:flavin oxidoreductase/NADH oxidase family protein n=1 Tax=Pseudoalteromonas sp. Of7M-16 TaxID=2917756 RepID=UPI001EF47FB1|nr:NADH:flavin oxidoreductase/NADH oxidase family protein [Pseudoalteromonas sp. Of7M-16]MCG7550586.1 NADH:flavin oxidoreductase/NADH oxidase family protein [Pseudoalteromonas sp. Of7M-16]